MFECKNMSLCQYTNEIKTAIKARSDPLDVPYFKQFFLLNNATMLLNVLFLFFLLLVYFNSVEFVSHF